MDAEKILQNNFENKEKSFLFYLKRQQKFNKEAFKSLIEAIRFLSVNEVSISKTARQINAVYGQILQCFMYHFDRDDSFKIGNMPVEYNKILQYLNDSVDYYFTTRI